jgi:archaemetzincin
MEPGAKCLGIVGIDLYALGLNFIFGEADISSGVAIISLFRLRREGYDLPKDEGLFQGRAIKEAVYEMGHTYHLSHCHDVKCVSFSNSLADTDIKGVSFCPKCQ